MPMKRVCYGATTHVGLVRGRNEDHLLAEPPLFVVADGMGGHRAGDVASAIATDSMRRLTVSPTTTAEAVLTAVRSADLAIRRESGLSEGLAGMGTTLVGLALLEASDQAIGFNVGDSRLYRIRAAAIEQLSTDHSLVQERIDAGVIAAADRSGEHDRNVLTRALGGDEMVEIDTWELELLQDDRYILCSDGLTNELSDDEILAAANELSDPADLSARLVDAANQAGGRDNVTVIVVDIGASDGSSRPDEEQTQPRGLLS
jgi:protein phosphatase